MKISKIRVVSSSRIHFESAKIYFLVRRRRLSFEASLPIVRGFVIFHYLAVYWKVFFPRSAEIDLSFFFPVKTFPISGAAI